MNESGIARIGEKRDYSPVFSGKMLTAEDKQHLGSLSRLKGDPPFHQIRPLCFSIN